MRVLVTGGAGFIGANLCRTLVRAGHEVVVVDDLSTGSKDNLLGVDTELAVGTILDPTLLDDVMAGTHAVVHLAARPSVPRSLSDPLASHTTNATGTVHVLEAARRATPTPHLVIASSSSVYGSNPVLPKHEELATRPVSPYGASKLAGEVMALAYQSSFEVPVLAFRLFNVFGPMQGAEHDYAAAVPRFVSRAFAGEPLVIEGDGHQTRDFTFVAVVADVIADAIERRITDALPVNLAFGTRTEVLELARMVCREVGVPFAVEHIAPRAGDVRHSQADSTRLRTLFPALEPVPLADALHATVEWFRTRADAA